MEAIPVIIADRSQLVRMGLTGILYQTGFTINIREVYDPLKLNALLLKEKDFLLIGGKGFLAGCPDELKSTLNNRSKRFLFIYINDIPQSINDVVFDEIIEYADNEKILYHKLERTLQKLVKPHFSLRTNEDISQREKEVLRLVALGMTNREIADRLYISAHTVITHRKNITAKLGIKTIAGLTVYAVINKLISAEEL
ncbi:MAG TPA: LuxR C-terminal-related transcriptional regulator [Bacteroidales bacterium]|nr:LuxR C-terminal-related transcriptional regulator [Bacteroidales bacterium]